jgi:hypothetical protein
MRDIGGVVARSGSTRGERLVVERPAGGVLDTSFWSYVAGGSVSAVD